MLWPFNHFCYRYRTVYSHTPAATLKAEEDSAWDLVKISFAGWGYRLGNDPSALWKIRLRKRRNMI